MVDDGDPKKGSKFNMSAMILWRINNMQNNAAGYYRNGETQKWYYEWKNIKFQIIGKLGADERTELTDLEDSIERAKKFSSAVKEIEEYMILIQDLIEKHEIGLVSKSDETVFS
jgi:hypothetical protein